MRYYVNRRIPSDKEDLSELIEAKSKNFEICIFLIFLILLYGYFTIEDMRKDVADLKRSAILNEESTTALLNKLEYIEKLLRQQVESVQANQPPDPEISLSKDMIHEPDEEELVTQQQMNQQADSKSLLSRSVSEISSRYFPYKYEAREDLLNLNDVKLINLNAPYQLEGQVQENIANVSQTTVRVDQGPAEIRFYPINAYKTKEEISLALAKGDSQLENRFDLGFYVEGLFERVRGLSGKANCSAEIYFSLDTTQDSFPRDVMSYLKQPSKLDDLVDESLKSSYLLSVRNVQCDSDGRVIRDGDFVHIQTPRTCHQTRPTGQILIDPLVEFMILRASGYNKTLIQPESDLR